MTELLALYRQAEARGIPVLHLPLARVGSLSVMDKDGQCYIGMDLQRRLTDAEQRVRLAHELGHCLTGSFYTRSSPCALRRVSEQRADRYAVRRLIPEPELSRALARGVTELWELAELFGVDVPTVQKALCLYTKGNLATELYFTAEPENRHY